MNPFCMPFVLVMSGLVASAALPQLKVSENRRFLVTEAGQPFFYLGDTAWELFHRLNREEAERYLRNRAAKGFNVVQAVALAEFEGLTAQNAYGHLPLKDNDPLQPNEAYFKHVDWIVAKANSVGIYVGLLPTWGGHATLCCHARYGRHLRHGLCAGWTNLQSAPERDQRGASERVVVQSKGWHCEGHGGFRELRGARVYAANSG